MYGMKMDDGNGGSREATATEKVVLAPVILPLLGMGWLIFKLAERAYKQSNVDHTEGK